MNLAIFGGSFDPPHKGHLEIIQKITKLDFIDLLIVLPTFLSPLKEKSLFSAKIRFKLVESMLTNIPKVVLSNYEISQNKPNYTIDSIFYFKNLYKPNKIYFVIGADKIDELPKWHRSNELQNEVEFIVASRDKINIPKHFINLQIDSPCKSSEIRKYILNNNFSDYKIESCLLDSTKIEVKTLNIKERLDFIINLLDSKKAQDIELFDLSKTSYITQYVIITTSLADKHSFALLDTLKTELKPKGEEFYATDEESGDWIIADLGEIMIHIFTENHRKKFNLEEFLSNYQKENNIE
ncbi:MAG: ribosome silencing factor [Helicobacteraceae bacterium]|nr:ribosome silencing factor [Helicobacteraceae bacterium]